ncbi:MAG: adenosine kinase [Candidatus Humimicrobiaceae bacterium]
MGKKTYDVVGIGNAIVDILANVREDFLKVNMLEKGSMQLVDEKESKKICSSVEIIEKNSGGSVANTIAGLASLGSKAAFIGKVKEDEEGFAFEESLKGIGVTFNTKKSKDGPSTAHCVVLVTPDAQRTMNTCLGIAGKLCCDDIDSKLIENARVVYLEGYLWDSREAKEAFLKAIKIAKKSGGKTALSLSDKFCVDCHREDFLDLVRNHLDILFANEEEAKSLFETEDLDKAINKLKSIDVISVITRSEKGSVIVNNGEEIEVEPEMPESVTDTTGAGDLYAAGFLHGLVKGYSLKTCGRIGSIVASDIINQFGARPKKPLAELLRSKNLNK